jgi:hypothetical protein
MGHINCVPNEGLCKGKALAEREKRVRQPYRVENRGHVDKLIASSSRTASPDV